MFRRCVLIFCSFLFSIPSGAATDLKTPLEKSNFTRLSTHAEMLAYLKNLDAKTKVMQIEIIGQSVENREIPALYFSLDKKFASHRTRKPVVLIYCQQHGNEPSSKEAALLLARTIVNNPSKYLANLDLILVPQVNADGGEKGLRRNANDMDLNRNHLILSEPEVIALHKLFLRWMPEVTLDMHEYNAVTKSWISRGLMKDAEEMLGGVTNINIAPEVINLTRNTIQPEVGQRIKDAGFRFARYIVGSPFNGNRVRFSTTAINDGRQSMGIYNTLSFIIEGKRYGDLVNNVGHRAKGQTVAMKAFLQVVGSHHEHVLNLVRKSREKLINPDQRVTDVVVQMDYFRDASWPKLKFPVFELNTWHHIQTEFENFYPVVKPVASIARPYAYIIPASENDLISLFKKHQIDFHILKITVEMAVTSYEIRHVTERIDEDKPVEYVSVKSVASRKIVPAGSFVILLNQKAANLIPLLLEPESTWAITKTRAGRKYRFKNYLQESSIYPILRIEKPVEFSFK